MKLSPMPSRNKHFWLEAAYVATVALALCQFFAPAAKAETKIKEEQPGRILPPIPLPPVPAKFRHPGILNTLEEIEAIKAKIQEGKEPWRSNFEVLRNSPAAAFDHKPEPHAVVSAGIGGKGGDVGGADDLGRDIRAAYTQTLLWCFTGDERYAQNAARIFRAWTVLKEFRGGNWYLTAAWGGANFAEAAELLRATYPKWAPDEIAAFKQMLRSTYLPILHNRKGYGNREFAVINGLMAIGVFTDDRAAFAEGMNNWLNYVPNWIYLKEDGPAPFKPVYWEKGYALSNEALAKLDEGVFPDVKASWIYYDEKMLAVMKEKKLGDDTSYCTQYNVKRAWNNAPPEAFVDGLCAETFRDLGHCDLGFVTLSRAAEIAWHQGIDLYSVHGERIAAFMELYSALRTEEVLPKVFWQITPLGMNLTFEIGYNHYHNRMGMDLPNTRRLIHEFIRPASLKPPQVAGGWLYWLPSPGIRASQYSIAGSSQWETLMHAEKGGTRPQPKSDN